MAYFKAYTYSFEDIKRTKWRIDILDDQASGGANPIELIPSETPLIIETLDSSDDKNVPIIGTMATLQYEYTGRFEEPIPDIFFDADERRFRVEIFKNDILYGIFYIKPDGGGYDDKYPPYTVTLTAVDGLAFIKGIDWNAYSLGLIDYRIMSLYEIIKTRGLDNILDTNIQINTINTLRPENSVGDKSFLNDLYIHSDMFIDFTKGPDKIYNLLEKQLTSFSSSLFISENIVWIRRIQDLYNNNIIAEKYVNGVLSQLPLPNIIKTIGSSEFANDGIIVDFNATNSSFPAIKEINYTLNYRGINKLINFLWNNFDGTNYTGWRKQSPLTVSRLGSGSISDPYAAFLNFVGEFPPDLMVTLSQGSTGTNDIFCNIGDVFQASFKYKFFDTSSFNIAIYMLDEATGDQYSLDGGGNWGFSANGYPNTIQMGRTGNKREGSFNISSQPIPPIIQDKTLSGNQMKVFFAIYAPTGLNTIDDVANDGIAIYPIKMSIYPISSAGRVIIDKNKARVSKVIDDNPFYFMDTGVGAVSNSIYINNAGTTAKNWSSTLNPTDKQDIEKHMADSIIDQYATAVRGWEGSIRSNNIEFWNIFVMESKPGKKFIMTKDKYDVRKAIHDCNLQQILPENGADTIYTEIDLEDSNNN